MNAKVYIGPSIEHTIQTGTSFKGGFPPKVEKALKNDPYLMDLMVPLENLAEARKQVRNPESSLGIIYRRAESKGK